LRSGLYREPVGAFNLFLKSCLSLRLFNFRPFDFFSAYSVLCFSSSTYRLWDVSCQLCFLSAFCTVGHPERGEGFWLT